MDDALMNYLHAYAHRINDVWDNAELVVDAMAIPVTEAYLATLD